MPTRNFFTQQEIDEARHMLELLPDLTPQRITRSGALENLKETILMLAKEKGYTAADIKSALDGMEFKFSEKAIAAVINEDNGSKKSRARKSATAQVKYQNNDNQTA